MEFLKKLILSETIFTLTAVNETKPEAVGVGEPPSTFPTVIILNGHHRFVFVCFFFFFKKKQLLWNVQKAEKNKCRK